MSKKIGATLKQTWTILALFLVPAISTAQNQVPEVQKTEAATEVLSSEVAAELDQQITQALSEIGLDFVQAKIAKPSLWVVLPKKDSDQELAGELRRAWNQKQAPLYDSASKVWKNRLRKDLELQDPHFELLQKIGLFMDLFVSLEIQVGLTATICDSVSHSHLKPLLPKIESYLASEFGFKMTETVNGLMIDGDSFLEKLTQLKNPEKDQFIQNFVTQASGYRNSLRFFIAYRDRSPSGHSVRKSDLTRYLYVTETLGTMTTIR